MSQGQVFNVVGFDSFQAALRAGSYEVFAKSSGDFRGELTRIDLDRVWMQRTDTNLPWLMNSANDRERAPLLFLADVNQAPLTEGGVQLSPGEILVYRQGSTKHTWTSGPNRLACISLTHEDLAAASEAIIGRELTAPSADYIMQPDPPAMERLTALHKAAGELAKSLPSILATPGVAQALEQKLVHAMVTCLGAHVPAEHRSQGLQHSKVIARFERFLEMKQYQPVYLVEICAAIGASERTLRTCCQEHYGLGPVRYLWLRRMHLIRRALQHASPGTTSVTNVATEYGFWELGRFAVEYRALFGESPRDTLRRAIGRNAILADAV